MSLPKSLEDEAQRVLPLVRAAFLSVLDSIPARPRRASEICRELGISQTLAWRIVQVADAGDPFAAVRYVPGESAVETFLGAAQAHGAPLEALERARSAVAQFKKLVRDHAGNRRSLELMMAGLARSGRAEADLPYRKEGFRCASHTWGIQVQTHIRTALLYPGSRDDCVHIAHVHGYYNLRRVRPEARWVLARRYMMTEDGAAHRVPVSEPIAPEFALENGFPLLRPFCSDPPPDIQRVAGPGNAIDDVWTKGAVGDQAAVTFYSGEVMRELPFRYCDARNKYAQFGLHIRTAVETLVLDVLVHRDLYGPLSPECLVLSDLWSAPWETGGDVSQADLLPCAEQVQFLGQGLAGVQTSEVPNYERLLHYVCEKLSWDGSQFHVYRLRMPYPVIGTAVAMRFPLPERPR